LRERRLQLHQIIEALDASARTAALPPISS